MTKKSRRVVYDLYDWLEPHLPRGDFRIVGIISGEANIEPESLKNFLMDLEIQAVVSTVYSPELRCCAIIATNILPVYTSLSNLFTLAAQRHKIAFTQITKHSS